MNVNSIREHHAEMNEALQWVTFQVGSERYGVNVLQVQEVLKYTEITPVPGAPHYVLGIINLRGIVVTVIDTRTRFGLQNKEVDETSRIIFVEVKGHIIGMLVDSVAEVVSLQLSDIESTPNVNSEENDNAKYIQGVFSDSENILILIDVDKLFTDEDFAEAVSD